MWDNDEEARRLKERFDSVKSQAAWARNHKLPGGPSMLSQHIHGRRPINLEAAIIYAAGFGVPLDQISPRLALQQQRAQSVAPGASHAQEPPKHYGQGSAPADLQTALQLLSQSVKAADAASLPEVRLRVAALVEGVDVEQSIQRLCELLAPATERTKRIAA